MPTVPPLLSACLWAVLAAVAAREGGLPAAALAASLPLLIALRRGRAGPELLAVPAALAATKLPVETQVFPPPGPVGIEGRVLGPVHADPLRGTTRFSLSAAGGAVRVVVEGLPEILPGDRVRALASCGPQHERRQAGRVPVVSVPRGGLHVQPGPPGPARACEALRLALQDQILRRFPGEPGLLLSSLVLGRGPELPADLARAHRATGLSHLLAVSGAHASMLAWLLGLLWLGRHGTTSKTQRTTVVLVLLVYAVLTGMEPPVFRAVAAFLLLLWAQSRGRRAALLPTLAVPALLTCLYEPQGLFGVSFGLSYAAVFGLSLAGALHRGGALRRLLWAPLCASFWATACTSPLTLHWFGQIAPWTVLATPLLAPLVAAMLAGGLLTGIVGLLVPGLADALALPVHGITLAYCRLVRACDGLPGTPILAPWQPDPWLLLAALLGGALLLVRWPDRRGVLGLCVLLGLPHFVPGTPPAAGLSLLSVGHGQACLAVLQDGASVLVDCGSRGSSRRAVHAAARSLRRRAVDWLVLTHGDDDHVGGIPELAQRVRIRRAILPLDLWDSDAAGALRAAGAEVVALPPGTVYAPRPDLRVFAPSGLSSAGSNDRSLWLRVQWSSWSALLTGDALEAGVDAALAAGFARPAEVLLLPHHGRAHGRAEMLLDAARPRVALVSNAAGEGEGDQGALARAAGALVLATGLSGTISVRDGNPPLVTAERPRPLW